MNGNTGINHQKMDNRRKELVLVKLAKMAIACKEDTIEFSDTIREKYWINTAKIDVDVKLESIEMALWEGTRIAILRVLDLVPVDVLIDRDVKNDERRGFHAVITFLSDVELADGTLNLIELLLGSDATRYEINKRRIEKGVTMKEGSILFSKILKRFPQEECEKCSLKRALEEIVGEM